MAKRKIIFDKKNVLIIGGAGFIGSHLCDELIETSKVICIDNFSTGNEKNIDHLLANSNFKFIKYDLTKPITLEEYTELQDFKIEFQGIQEIYNLACPTSPIDFEKNRVASLLANSYAVKNGLDLALKYQAKFMHFSSSVVYGGRLDDFTKATEEKLGLVDQLSERCSYDEGKRFAESMVKTYADVYQVDAKIIRPFRIYGPRMPLDEGLMIPDFISNALDDKDLIIYGNESFKTSFCYVDDCINAALKFMETKEFGPINIGSDVDINLTDIANQIIKMLESKSKVVYEKPMLFMTPLALPDISKAKELLSWMPLVTFNNGLEKTINNLRAQKGLKTIDYKDYK
ncbi:MAG: NAD-dependent epimerase/dehydratase family protein [bacterium]